MFQSLVIVRDFLGLCCSESLRPHEAMSAQSMLPCVSMEDATHLRPDCNSEPDISALFAITLKSQAKGSVHSALAVKQAGC